LKPSSWFNPTSLHATHHTYLRAPFHPRINVSHHLQLTSTE
jgi:hypothetical protein